MNGMDAERIAALIEQRKWVPLAAAVIWLLIRLSKSDTKYVPTLPPRVRIWAALLLGVASGVLEHVTAGKSWAQALTGGFVSVAIAVLFHESVVSSARAGHEFPLPWLTEPNRSPSPTAPVTIAKPPSIVLLPLPGDAKTPVPSGSDSDVTRHSPNNED